LSLAVRNPGWCDKFNHIIKDPDFYFFELLFLTWGFYPHGCKTAAALPGVATIFQAGRQESAKDK
jgi:hypothetical protein